MSSRTPDRYTKQFESAIQRLNTVQALAVQDIDGPMMLLAGPGTGKTQVLTARIGTILQETDTQASEILCLTFTDAGVVAMRERLIKYIGPEAYRVPIMTYHGFCNRVILENPGRFNNRPMVLVDDFEKNKILRTLLDKLPPDHILVKNYYTRHQHLTHLRGLFQTMKTEGWSYTTIQSAAQEYMDSLPTNPDYIYKRKTKDRNAGDLKQSKIDEEQTRMDKLVAGASLFEDFQRNMVEAGYFEYADMLNLVVSHFQRDTNLLKRYQEQYQYILIDEYQDTNGRQNQLIQILADFWENPNLFVVGDDNQAIYEFQGARIANLIDLYHKYPAIQLLALHLNYRSCPEIIDIATRMINNNTQRLENIDGFALNRTLETYNKSPAEIHLWECANEAHQHQTILDKILSLQSSNVPLSEIAVIARWNASLASLTPYLEAAQLPYKMSRPTDILSQGWVPHFLLCMEYIAQERRQYNAGESLFFPMIVLKYLRAGADHPATVIKDIHLLARYRAIQEERPYWRDLLVDTAIQAVIGVENTSFFVSLAENINYHVEFSYELPLAQWVEKFLIDWHFLTWITQQKEEVNLLDQWKALENLIQTRSKQEPNMNLDKFLRQVKQMQVEAIRVPSYPVIEPSGGLVLTTAHSAKGLEFEAVIIMDCSIDWERQKKNSNNFKLPETLTKSNEEDPLEASRRLMYVAMTRAKSHLIMTYPALKGKTDKSASRFMVETGLEIEVKQADSVALTRSIINILRLPEQEWSNSWSADWHQERLKTYAMSASSLNAYIDCPLRFYYEYWIGIQGTYSVQRAYGTTIHKVLHYWLNTSIKSYNVPATTEELVNYYSKLWEDRKTSFPTSDWESYLKKGQMVLRNYLAQATLPKEALAEYSIRQMELEGVPVTGSIDRVDFMEGVYAEIIDYKTGKPDSTKLNKPTAKNALGGTYYRQLLFYALIFERQRLDSRISRKGRIIYVEADDPTSQNKTIEITSEQKVWILDLIKNTYSSIKEGHFDGCGKESCTWCQLLTNHVLPEKLEHEETVDMDD